MLYIIIIVVIAVIFIVIEQQNLAKKNKEISEAEAEYRMALKEKDKARALSCGRHYYALLNAQKQRSKQPLYDSENIIANDLRAMDDAFKQ